MASRDQIKDVIVDVEGRSSPSSELLGLDATINEINALGLGRLVLLTGVDTVVINKFGLADGGGGGWEAETQVQYNVLNGRGEQMFYAGEDANGCSRCCLSYNRPYVAYLFDQDGKVVVTMRRECTLRSIFCGTRIAGSTVRVTSRTGELYGSVTQKISCGKPSYVISDKKGKDIMFIKGPTCSCCVGPRCGDKLFKISLTSRTKLNEVMLPGQGQGKGQWGQDEDEDEDDINTDSGLRIVGSVFNEVPQSSDEGEARMSGEGSFGLHLEPNLDPRNKALLIGASFAIDFSFFDIHFAYPWSVGCAVFFTVLTVIIVALTIWISAVLRKSKS